MSAPPRKAGAGRLSTTPGGDGDHGICCDFCYLLESRAARNRPAEAEPALLLSRVSGLPPCLLPLGLDNFFFSILIPDYFTDPRLPNKIHMQLIKEKKAA